MLGPLRTSINQIKRTLIFCISKRYEYTTRCRQLLHEISSPTIWNNMDGIVGVWVYVLAVQMYKFKICISLRHVNKLSSERAHTDNKYA